MSSNLMEQSAAAINDKFKAQASEGVIIQGYCQGIIKQPLAGFENTKDDIQIMINHANHYLNTLYPQIITNITNIADYYMMHNNITNFLSYSASPQEWLQMLTIMERKARKHAEGSKKTANDFTAFSGKISTAATAFNAKLQGNLQSEFKGIEDKIAATMRAAVLSGFVEGGAILVTVGSLIDSVMDSVTITTGVSGTAAAITGLTALLKEKSTILEQQPQLTKQVIALEAINASYQNLASQVATAIHTNQQMSNAWALLGNNIHHLGNNLNDGRINTRHLRDWFMRNSGSKASDIPKSTEIIKEQMTSISTKVAASGESLSDFLAKQG